MLWGLEVGEVFLEQPDDNTHRVRYGFEKRAKLFEVRHPACRFFCNFF
jgi:hypothetical protein